MVFLQQIIHNTIQTIDKILHLEIFQSNAFNFILLVIILAYIIKKVKIDSLLNAGINRVKETIDKSTLAKDSSINELKQAQEKISNVQNEIKEIEQKNEEIILKSEEKISNEAQKQVKTIKESVVRIIDAKEKEIISKLSKKTIIASIELAKEHIKNVLKKNPEYHRQFIDESVKELDRLEYGQQK